MSFILLSILYEWVTGERDAPGLLHNGGRGPEGTFEGWCRGTDVAGWVPVKCKCHLAHRNGAKLEGVLHIHIPVASHTEGNLTHTITLLYILWRHVQTLNAYHSPVIFITVLSIIFYMLPIYHM